MRIEGIESGSMDLLREWTLDSDHVLSF